MAKHVKIVEEETVSTEITYVRRPALRLSLCDGCGNAFRVVPWLEEGGAPIRRIDSSGTVI